MKRVLVFIFFLLLMFICVNFTHVICQENSITKYNHVFYSQELNRHVYPMIKQHIKQYKHHLTKDECQQIVNELHEKLMIHFTEKNFPILGTPYLSIVKNTNDPIVVYVLHIIIILPDVEESSKTFKVTMEYSKRFVMFEYNKNKVHVENQKSKVSI